MHGETPMMLRAQAAIGCKYPKMDCGGRRHEPVSWRRPRGTEGAGELRYGQAAWHLADRGRRSVDRFALFALRLQERALHVAFAGELQVLEVLGEAQALGRNA